MADDDLDAIEARLDAATPGPWRVGGGNSVWWGNAEKVAQCGPSLGPHPDARLIAAAPTDLRSLVTELRAARAVIEAARVKDAAMVAFEKAVLTDSPGSPQANAAEAVLLPAKGYHYATLVAYYWTVRGE